MSTTNVQKPGVCDSFNAMVLDECSKTLIVGNVSGGIRAAGGAIVATTATVATVVLAAGSVVAPKRTWRQKCQKLLPDAASKIRSGVKHFFRGSAEVLGFGPTLYIRDQNIKSKTEIALLRMEQRKLQAEIATARDASEKVSGTVSSLEARLADAIKEKEAIAKLKSEEDIKLASVTERATKIGDLEAQLQAARVELDLRKKQFEDLSKEKAETKPVKRK